MFNKLAAKQRPLNIGQRARYIHEISIKGNEAATTTPEGQQVSMDVEALLQLVGRHGGRQINTGCLLPDNVKMVKSRGPMTIWVYERPPQVYSLRWIAGDSPAPFGEGATYRSVRIALPYLIVLAVFAAGRHGRLQLTPANECFFRNHPLKSPDDELFYPALLNCSKFNPQEGHPLSWICTANLQLRMLSRNPDENRRMRDSMQALLHCLLETGYNKSSEHHEESSWFTESAGVDPRIATIEGWEKATAADSLFVLDVPWLKTGKTLGQVMDRIFDNAKIPCPRMASSNDLARLMINNCSEESAAPGGENSVEPAGKTKSPKEREKDVLGAIIDEIF